jgi:uncharacterized membrane protein YhaH (DUF805 family)
MPETVKTPNVFQEYFINIFRYKYIQYKGRARRKEFWMFYLFSSIFSFVLGLFPVLGGIYSLVVMLPTICLSIRRLHDIGKSGWWLMLPLVSFIGVLGFLVLDIGVALFCMALLFSISCITFLAYCCLDSQPDENQYGPNPQET